MAVSGRKPPDLSESVLKSSAEDFDHKCDPCLSDKQVVEAAGFCVTCQEYLCKNCFKFHKKTSALKLHELLDEASMLKASTSAVRDGSKPSPEIFTERCSTHKIEFIKFFCPKHDTLCCTDCITLNHRTCKIDYIPDKCEDVGNGEEYTELIRNLDQKMKETECVMKKAEHRDKHIDTQYENVKKEVVKQRRKIDERLNKMQDNVNEIIESRRSLDKKDLKEAIRLCIDSSRDVKKMQTSLQDNKVSKKNIQLYIGMKEAKSKLKTNNIQLAEQSLDNMNVQYKFKSNEDLEKLTDLSILGEVSFPSNVSRRERYAKCLTYTDKINVKTTSDKAFFKCNVKGCAALSSNKVVLIDSEKNQKIKVVDIENKAVIDEKVMDPPPSGITALPNDQIAVTVAEKKEILIMAVNNELSLVRTIRLVEECKSITYCQDRLYVLCNNPNCILILDTHGQVLKKLPLKDIISGNTKCIVFNEKMIYIHEHLHKDINTDVYKVIGFNLNGDVSAECIINGGFSDMVALNDGSLLVSTTGSPDMYRISQDLKECYPVDIDIDSFSVCYSGKLGKVYIGSYGSDLLKICDVKL